MLRISIPKRLMNKVDKQTSKRRIFELGQTFELFLEDSQIKAQHHYFAVRAQRFLLPPPKWKLL